MTCPACRAPNDETAVACAVCGGSLMPHTLGTLKPGALVAARYEVLEFVGKGGMGVVLKARDKALDEVVALKVLRADLAESAEMDRRFRTEIKLARRVRHRNVCAIHEYGEDGPLRYISMEFIEGTDLRQIVRVTGGPLPREAYEIAEQAAEGLSAIHEAGIIHRDLKTSNIMRDSRGVVRLMDFGIAKDSSGELTAGATGTGQLIGTPEYMSPEQIRGERIDFRSDVYSLGIVIFEVFTGRVPFQADTPIATILKHLQEPVPLDGPEAARLPSEVMPLLGRALAKDRAARQSTAAELLEDLRRARGASFPDAASARGTEPVTRPMSGGTAPTASSRVTERPTATPTLAAAPATVAIPPPPPAHRAAAPRRYARTPPGGRAARRWALWVSLPVLVLAAASGAFLAVRFLGPQPSGNAPESAAPAAPGLPRPSTQPATLAPASATPAASAPSPSPAAAGSTRPRLPASPPAMTGPSSADLAAIERTAATDADAALAQATALASRHPADATLRQRVVRYRGMVASRLLSRGHEALAKAEAEGTLEAYLEANRLFSKSLDAEPSGQGARDGLVQAIRGEERVRARLTQVSFEQTSTEVSGAPPTGLPPGLAAPPSGVVVKPAQPAGPRARIAIEIEPRLLKPGEPYVIRYFLQNESNGTLLLAGASIQNQIGESGVTGGRVEPVTATVPPRARSLLFEARDVWRHELGTAWRTTLRVFLTDGSVFNSSLAAHR